MLENDLPGEGVEEAHLHARGPHIDAQHVGAVLHKHNMISIEVKICTRVLDWVPVGTNLRKTFFLLLPPASVP